MVRSWGVASLITIMIGCTAGSHAQDSSNFILSGYAEVYYGYDFGQPENGERPDFLYNHKRHNEINANLALIRGGYARDRVRGVVALRLPVDDDLLTGHLTELLRPPQHVA